MSDTQIVAECAPEGNDPMPNPNDRVACAEWAERSRQSRMTPEDLALEARERTRRAKQAEKDAVGAVAQARAYLNAVREKSGMNDEDEAIVAQGLEAYYDALLHLNGLIYTRDEWLEYDHGVYHKIADYDLRAKITAWLILRTCACTDTPNVTPGFVTAVVDALKGLCHVMVEAQLPYQLVMPPMGEPQQWQAAKYNRVVFGNGVVCLDEALSEGLEGALEPFSGDWVSLSKLPYNFDPGASCELWSQTLEEIFPEAKADDHRIEVLQEFFGWCLAGRMNLEAFLLLHGEGANGKTVVLDVLEAMIGRTNCAHLSLADVSNRFMLGELANKLVNISGDMTHVSRADEGRLKMLVSGNPMTVDRKNKDPLLLVPSAKMVFACNTLPAMSDKSEGIWRRCVVVPFLETFEGEGRDIERAKKIVEEELSGVFNWALEGLRRLRAQGGFTACGVSADASAEYRSDNDPVKQFYDERCVKDRDSVTSVTEAYSIYSDWCGASGYRVCNKNNFSKQLKKHSKIESERVGPNNARVRAYRGLRIVRGEAFVNRGNRHFELVGD